MASVSTDGPLSSALHDFRQALTTDQQRRLETLREIPDASSVLVFTAELDYENSKRNSRCVASRLSGFLEATQQFSSIVETFVSSNPAIAALVWGTVKFTILVASNSSSYFDKLSRWFMKLRKCCPRYTEYQALFSHSSRLQDVLCKFYATVVRFCQRAVGVIERKGLSQAFIGAWNPFERDFATFENDLQACNEDVQEEIRLAAQQAAHEERQLQHIERERGGLFRQRIVNGNKEAAEWRIQADRRRRRKRRKQLLDTLSSHDYLSAFQQERRKRHGQTGRWLFETAEYKDWIRTDKSSLFWCHGIVGSGKTVLTASVIDDLLLQPGTKKSIAFFFCRSEALSSLQSQNILRCLIRQFLEDEALPRVIEEKLDDLTSHSALELSELETLLEAASSTSTRFIVIDAIDECEKSHRKELFKFLRGAIDSASHTTKVYLSSRGSVSPEIKRSFRSFYERPMNSKEASMDIGSYVEGVMKEKMDDGDLVINQQQIIAEVRDALTIGAHGMILWVTYQLQEICAQTCDNDIREVIKNLPKDLEETYERMLHRLVKADKVKIATKVLCWVTVARRPLYLDELREAIAIEPLQSSSQPERLVNDINQIVPWCENLVFLDEETQSVHFAHPSIKDFLLCKRSDKSLIEFQLQLSDIDRNAGEICVTYLHFGDFQTQLAKNPASATPLRAALVLSESLPKGPPRKVLSSLSKLRSSLRTRPVDELDLLPQLSQHLSEYNTAATERQTEHPFLNYASEYWLSHTASFAPDRAKIWGMWRTLLDTENHLGHKPWPQDDWIQRTDTLVAWIIQNDHAAMLKLVESSTEDSFLPEQRQEVLLSSTRLKKERVRDTILHLYVLQVIDLCHCFVVASETGDLQFIEMMLAPDKTPVGHARLTPTALLSHSYQGRTAIEVASGKGRAEVVLRLLRTAIDLHGSVYQPDIQLGLLAAARDGQLKVVEILLREGAHFYHPGTTYWIEMAFQDAIKEGHLAVFKALLTAGAYVDAADVVTDTIDTIDTTALYLAAQNDSVKLVEALLEAGANFKPLVPKGYQTALQMAISCGHVKVAEALLAAGTDANAVAVGIEPATALGTAIESGKSGRLAFVEALLNGGADANAPCCKGGRTALFTAAGEGHVGIVEKLLDAGAEVDVPATFDGDMRKPLQIAALHNHWEVVQILLRAGANANLRGSEDQYTALHSAAHAGNLIVVKMLLEAGADVEATHVVGTTKWTSSQLARRNGHRNVVKLLEVAENKKRKKLEQEKAKRYLESTLIRPRDFPNLPRLDLPGAEEDSGSNLGTIN